MSLVILDLILLTWIVLWDSKIQKHGRNWELKSVFFQMREYVRNIPSPVTTVVNPSKTLMHIEKPPIRLLLWESMFIQSITLQLPQKQNIYRWTFFDQKKRALWGVPFCFLFRGSEVLLVILEEELNLQTSWNSFDLTEISIKEYQPTTHLKGKQIMLLNQFPVIFYISWDTQ